jgi:colanic acid/amylovoran biosynthesis glycosyltransferase
MTSAAINENSGQEGASRSIHPPTAADRQLTVCIVYPLQGRYSETFIRQHIERLPAKVVSVHGGPVPTWYAGDRPLLSPRFAHKALRTIARHAFGVTLRTLSGRALQRYLEGNRVDVVLAEYGPTAVFVMDACRSSGVPLVAHFHGFDAHSLPVLEKYREDYARLFEQAAAIVVVSKTMAAQLIALGAPADKVVVSSCGVDLETFEGGAPAAAPAQFLAVGRFVDKKAPHLTLLAFAKVLEACPEARLVMAGDGPLLDACKTLAAALGLQHAIEFTGPVAHDRIRVLMATARAFVQHSLCTTYGDSEGTPVAVLEASGMGLPVISTRHAGIQDAVLHERTGFLVLEGDITAMAQHMIRVARDPALAAKLGAEGRRFIAQNFSVDQSIERLFKTLQAAALARRAQSDQRSRAAKQRLDDGYSGTSR